MHSKMLGKTPKNFNDLLEITEWRSKIIQLSDQIETIEKIKGVAAISVAVVILKTQLIEFELKQLITELDLFICFSLRESHINRITRSPKVFNNATFGAVVKAICEYRSPILTKLQREVKELNTKRNKYVHHLFDPKISFEQLKLEADKTVLLASSVIEEINKIQIYIRKNDPLNNTVNVKI